MNPITTRNQIARNADGDTLEHAPSIDEVIAQAAAVEAERRQRAASKASRTAWLIVAALAWFVVGHLGLLATLAVPLTLLVFVAKWTVSAAQQEEASKTVSAACGGRGGGNPPTVGTRSEPQAPAGVVNTRPV